MFNVRDKVLRLKNIFREQALVIMYHRIGKAAVDPWQLSVSETNFEKQLQFLSKNHVVISLPQLVGQLKEKSFKKKVIAITFDDGYADNYSAALPLLIKYKLPATFFVTSKNIGLKKEFWWDELERILLEVHTLPKSLSLEINGQNFSYDLGDETSLTDNLRAMHKKYIAFEQGTLRSQLYCRIWEMLSPLNSERQEMIMQQIRTWAGVHEDARPEYCCMSPDDISAIASNNLFTIGGHTVNHPALAHYQKEVQKDEIVNNLTYLEHLTGRQINLFAYPSGNYNKETLEIISNAGLDGAFTTKEKKISSNSEMLQLGRFQVNDWHADKLAQKLSNWSKYSD